MTPDPHAHNIPEPPAEIAPFYFPAAAAWTASARFRVPGVSGSRLGQRPRGTKQGYGGHPHYPMRSTGRTEALTHRHIEERRSSHEQNPPQQAGTTAHTTATSRSLLNTAMLGLGLLFLVSAAVGDPCEAFYSSSWPGAIFVGSAQAMHMTQGDGEF